MTTNGKNLKRTKTYKLGTKSSNVTINPKIVTEAIWLLIPVTVRATARDKRRAGNEKKAERAKNFRTLRGESNGLTRSVNVNEWLRAIESEIETRERSIITKTTTERGVGANISTILPFSPIK